MKKNIFVLAFFCATFFVSNAQAQTYYSFSNYRDAGSYGSVQNFMVTSAAPDVVIYNLGYTLKTVIIFRTNRDIVELKCVVRVFFGDVVIPIPFPDGSDNMAYYVLLPIFAGETRSASHDITIDNLPAGIKFDMMIQFIDQDGKSVVAIKFPVRIV